MAAGGAASSSVKGTGGGEAGTGGGGGTGRAAITTNSAGGATGTARATARSSCAGQRQQVLGELGLGGRGGLERRFEHAVAVFALGLAAALAFEQREPEEQQAAAGQPQQAERAGEEPERLARGRHVRDDLLGERVARDGEGVGLLAGVALGA